MAKILLGVSGGIAAYKAVEFVHERIEGVSGDARVVLLPGTLVERASTVHSTQAAS